jgi:hypothetical protein
MPDNLQPETMKSWMRSVNNRLARVERPSRMTTVQYTGVAAPTLGTDVTSGTFVNVWNFSLSQVVADAVRVGVTVTTPASTTAEVRLNAPGLTGLPSTSVAAIGANLVRFITFDWTPPGLALGQEGILIQVQARRVSGSGNVLVARPRIAMQLPSYEYDAVDDGNPQIA